MDKPKIVAIIQARLNSTRQPAKVMLDLCGKTLLQRVIDRVRQAQIIDEVWVATSDDPREDVVAHAAEVYGVKVYRGDLDNLMDRYLGAAQASEADIVVRVTSDNPLTESRFIDLGVKRLLEENLDYLDFNDIPYGAHVWMFTHQALIRAAEQAKEPDELEHVVLHFIHNPDEYRIVRWTCPIEAIRKPQTRITLDTMEDYVRLYKVFQHFEGDSAVALEDALPFIEQLENQT
jgi:spore coat polysaccharide biosynthesis protein SpsF